MRENPVELRIAQSNRPDHSPSPQRFLVVVVGSYGDLNPCLAIARGLRERGHKVTFLTTDYYRAVMDRLGFEMVSILPRDEFLRIFSHPDFNHRFKTFKFQLRELWLAIMRREFQAIEQRYEPSQTAVLTLGLPFGPRLAQEKLGVPMATLAHFPQYFRSIHDPHGISGRDRFWSLRARRWLRAAVTARTDSLVGPGINQFRAELGLPPVRNIFGEWLFSPQLILGLFPEWWTAPQPDWPSQVHLTGFPISDGGDEEKLVPEVEEFLQGGDPPLVINALSAIQRAREFFDIAVAAAQRMGRRAILLSPFAQNVPPDLPAQVRHFSYVPHSLLLPRSAGILHQGGIGTTAKALLAGVPQVIVPVNFDQPYNARCVAAMGVGAMLPVRQFQPERLAREFKQLDSAQVSGRLKELSSRIRQQDGVAEACRAIEQVLLRTPAVPA